MKVQVEKMVEHKYYDIRTIEVEVPDGNDVNEFIMQFKDSDEGEEAFMEADVEEKFSDPLSEYISVNGEVINK